MRPGRACRRARTASAARAASPEDFPVKRVSFYIGFAAGGYDSYARLVTRHMGRHLPGNPDVVPMNMPGAGSVKLVQFLNGAAPTDGSAIGIIDRGLFVAIFTNPAIPKFDFQAMNWIGSITNENLLCVSWHASPVKTFADMRSHEFVTGGVTQGVAWTSATVMQKMLGAKIKFISGYPGGNDISIAMERGELDGRCAWSHSSIMASNPDVARREEDQRAAAICARAQPAIARRAHRARGRRDRAAEGDHPLSLCA